MPKTRAMNGALTSISYDPHRPVTTRMEALAMAVESLTYAALGKRLGCSSEAARALAKRLRLQTRANNLQQSWRFDWEPPKAVLRDVWTID
jgi:hypothetical protein